MPEDPWAHWWKQQRHSTWRFNEFERGFPIYVWVIRFCIAGLVLLISMLVFGGI